LGCTGKRHGCWILGCGKCLAWGIVATPPPEANDLGLTQITWPKPAAEGDAISGWVRIGGHL